MLWPTVRGARMRRGPLSSVGLAQGKGLVWTHHSKGTVMKSTKLALVIVLLLGSLSACKQEPAAPATEAPPPAVAPASTPAPEPAVAPATDPAAAPAATDAAPVDAEEEDTPHSGGDKVGVGN